MVTLRKEVIWGVKTAFNLNLNERLADERQRFGTPRKFQIASEQDFYYSGSAHLFKGVVFFQFCTHASYVAVLLDLAQPFLQFFNLSKRKRFSNDDFQINIAARILTCLCCRPSFEPATKVKRDQKPAMQIIRFAQEKVMRTMQFSRYIC